VSSIVASQDALRVTAAWPRSFRRAEWKGMIG
jgi:hypothetical protein